MNKTPFDLAQLNPKAPVLYKGSNGLDLVSIDGQPMAQHSCAAPTIATFILDDSYRLLMLRKISPSTGSEVFEVPKFRSVSAQEPETTALEGVRSICGVSPHLNDVVSIGLIHPEATHLANATNMFFTRVEAVMSELNLNLEDGATPVYLSFSKARKYALEDLIQDATTIAGIFRLAAARQ